MGESDSSRTPSGPAERKHKKDKKGKKEKKEEKRRRVAANHEPEEPTSSSGDEQGGLLQLACLPSSSTTISADLINSMLTTVNSLVTEVQSMHADMGSVREELHTQRKQMDHVLNTVQKFHAEAEHERQTFRTELAATNKQIEEKIAALDIVVSEH
jgi:hypothetical protein